MNNSKYAKTIWMSFYRTQRAVPRFNNEMRIKSIKSNNLLNYRYVIKNSIKTQLVCDTTNSNRVVP